ncbi:ABC transporter permease subunit [Ideonella livida]|uniref:ABC transporter permease subunit n=1 Tax=Ideonella livida TaxID=2707176 RepID=UPI002872F068|nr:ABC transporter permease subunit [Ideonella livida]
MLTLLVLRAQHTLSARGIQAGWQFLLEPAGFDVGEPRDLGVEATGPLWQALAVGLLNTLRAAALALCLALGLGTAVGLARLTPHPLLRALAAAWVGALRNVPLLVQLLLGYLLWVEMLPPMEAPWLGPGGLLLCKAGLALPAWTPTTSGGVSWPVVDGLSVSGGWVLTPEFLTLSLGLGLYTSAFVAEVVRGGLMAVAQAQWQAAQALGMTRWQALRGVIAPQALRVIVPPLTNQVLNLVKNSSLAVAVGYPDLASVTQTTLNQTGRALECMAILMGIYLGLSALVAWLGHALDRRAGVWQAGERA